MLQRGAGGGWAVQAGDAQDMTQDCQFARCDGIGHVGGVAGDGIGRGQAVNVGIDGAGRNVQIVAEGRQDTGGRCGGRIAQGQIAGTGTAAVTRGPQGIVGDGETGDGFPNRGVELPSSSAKDE